MYFYMHETDRRWIEELFLMTKVIFHLRCEGRKTKEIVLCEAKHWKNTLAEQNIKLVTGAGKTSY